MTSKIKFTYVVDDLPCIFVTLNLSLCLSSRFARVNTGRVPSNRTNWKHFFPLLSINVEFLT